MANKEDILEQIVEEYLIQKGYFVQHNIKYRPRKDHPNYIANKDSVYSDIDIIGVHPLHRGERKVLVVSCKSWQAGFNPESMINAIENCKNLAGRPSWKIFRELTVEKWSESFIEKSSRSDRRRSLYTRNCHYTLERRKIDLGRARTIS